MNKLFLALLLGSISMTTYAATTPENKDDGSAIGTSESPQVQKQQNRTDKGATGVHQEGVTDDASNLGTSESPQVVKQTNRTNKGASERPAKRDYKNKVMKQKEENAGTTKGNPVQPTEPEQASPAVN